jgi:DNA-binding response OmpR family regulator
MAKARILVVDDEAAITRLVRLNLEQAGYEVKEENAGRRALGAVRSFRPDLVLLDVMMPDADGSEIANAIRCDATVGGTPIVFMTAIVSRKEAQSKQGQIGGNRFIAKPVAAKDLLTAIEAELAGTGQSGGPRA